MDHERQPPAHVVSALRGGLVVSCQPQAPLDEPAYVAALARAVVEAGAAAVRVEGAARIAQVRSAVAVPIIGILKRRAPDAPAYITVTREDVESVLRAGADVVAMDGRDVRRPDGSTFPELLELAHAAGAAVMADVSNESEARYAAGHGSDLVATTLSGYTSGSPAGPEPDLELVAALAAAAGPPVIAEGRLNTPDAVRAAFERGAHAVVVGRAITEPRFVVERFLRALPGARAS